MNRDFVLFFDGRVAGRFERHLDAEIEADRLLHLRRKTSSREPIWFIRKQTPTPPPWTQEHDVMGEYWQDELRKALRERGHSDERIYRMSSAKMFDEYCAWHLGDPGWGRSLRKIYEAAKVIGGTPTTEEE